MAAPIPPTAAEASVAVGGADKIKRAALDFPPVATSASSRLVRFAGGDGVEGAWTVTGLFPMIPYILNLPCTMTIYRAADGNLVLFNALRVPEEMEDEILELGPIKHIVKTGQFHGAADAYWTLHEKFGRPKYWAMPGASIAEGFKADEVLTKDNVPVPGAILYQLDGHPFPEAVITLPLGEDGPLLVATDVLVHMEHTVGVPIIGRLMMNMFGFLSTPGVPQCAPLWARTSVKMMGKERVQAWIDDIMNLSWGSFVSSHGSPVLKCDHKAVRQAVYKQIGC